MTLLANRGSRGPPPARAESSVASEARRGSPFASRAAAAATASGQEAGGSSSNGSQNVRGRSNRRMALRMGSSWTGQPLSVMPLCVTGMSGKAPARCPASYAVFKAFQCATAFSVNLSGPLARFETRSWMLLLVELTDFVEEADFVPRSPFACSGLSTSSSPSSLSTSLKFSRCGSRIMMQGGHSMNVTPTSSVTFRVTPSLPLTWRSGPHSQSKPSFDL